MPITDKQYQALLDRHSQMIQEEIARLEQEGEGGDPATIAKLAGYQVRDRLKAEHAQDQAPEAEQAIALADIARQEAEEMAQVQRGSATPERRQLIRAKYNQQRADLLNVQVTYNESTLALEQKRDAQDAELYGFPSNMDSVSELERAYRAAKAKIRRGDWNHLDQLKRAYRREFARLGYRLNE